MYVSTGYTVLADLVLIVVDRLYRFIYCLRIKEVDAAVGGDQPDVADLWNLKESFQQPAIMCPIRRIRDALQFASQIEVARRRLTLAALTPLLPIPLEEQVVRGRAERRPLGGALHTVCSQYLLCAQFALLLKLRLVRHQQLLQFLVARGQHLSHALSSRRTRQRSASTAPQLKGSKFG